MIDLLDEHSAPTRQIRQSPTASLCSAVRRADRRKDDSRRINSMTASRPLITALLLGVLASACRRDAVTSTSPDVRSASFDRVLQADHPRAQSVVLARKPIVPSEREQRLMERIVALHPAEAAAPLRALLANRTARLHLPAGAEAQPLLDELAAMRARDSVPSREPVDATVLLVDRLSNDSASAIVVRRANMVPHDVILLGRGAATSDALGAGLSALFKMRQSMGDVPTHDARVMIYGRGKPHNWKSSLQRDRATLDLDDLQQAIPQSVPGYGMVRAIDVPLKRMDRPAGGSPTLP